MFGDGGPLISIDIIQCFIHCFYKVMRLTERSSGIKLQDTKTEEMTLIFMSSLESFQNVNY